MALAFAVGDTKSIQRRVLADDDAVEDWEESWLKVVGGDRRRDADLSVAGS